MAALHVAELDQLPDEMFHIVQAATRSPGPRLASLSLPRRRTLETPNYLGITSRGIIPHITQDTFARDTAINGVVEVIERAPKNIPPICNFKPPDGVSPLRRFIALPDDVVLVLGARRTPPVIAPAANPNTNTTVSICTAVGFRPLKAHEFIQVSEQLQPDIIVGLGDIPYGRALGWKRIEKATERQIQWIQDHVAIRQPESGRATNARLFAPMLPVSCAKQDLYVEHLTDRLANDVSGLAVYDLATLEDLPAALVHLPRLGLTLPTTPHQILCHIALGIDILTVPFVGVATDAGIALDFDFPVPQASLEENGPTSPKAMGVDMWLSEHETDLSPLVKGCTCYACSNHHRAYLKHLLGAKEMLGWVLLQIHNHHIIDLFFTGIRQSIAKGTYEEDVQSFEKLYESHLPEKTGQGPRVRGYQFKSEGPSEPKKNPTTFMVMNNGHDGVTEAGIPGEAANGQHHDGLDLAKNGV